MADVEKFVGVPMGAGPMHSKKGANKPKGSAASFIFTGRGTCGVSDELSGTLMAQSRMHVITSVRPQQKSVARDPRND